MRAKAGTGLMLPFGKKVVYARERGDAFRSSGRKDVEGTTALLRDDILVRDVIEQWSSKTGGGAREFLGEAQGENTTRDERRVEGAAPLARVLGSKMRV